MPEPGEDDSSPETGQQKSILPVCRVFMLSSLLFYVGYSYAINEGFGIPLLLEAGVNERYAPIVFGISSIVSVFVGEYLGSASDRCTSLLGRRRPYIIGLSVVIGIAAILYPYGITLSDLFKLKDNSKMLYVTIHTAVCVVIFDVFLDMTNQIDRSFLTDSITAQQNDVGNSIFSAMVNAGSCLGSFISSLDWEKIFKLSTGGQTKVVFATIIIILFICIILTLTSVKEPHIGKDGEVQQYSVNSRWPICCNYFAFDLYKKPGNLLQYELQEMPSLVCEDSVAVINEDFANFVTKYEHRNESEEPVGEQSDNCQNIFETDSLQDSFPKRSFCEIDLQNLEQSSNEQHTDDYDDNMDQKVIGIFKYKDGWMSNLLEKLYARIYGAFNFIKSLSTATIWLWVIHLLEWVTGLCLSLFLTSYVGSVVYHGSPDTDQNSESFRNYNKGIRMGFACLSIEYGSAFIFSLLFKRILTIVRLRELCIGIHTLTFISSGLLVIFNNIYFVACQCIIFGWFFSTIEIIPFIIIQQYKVCSYITIMIDS